jgi:hypothetical protein
MLRAGVCFLLTLFLMLTSRAALAQGVGVEKHPVEVGAQLGFVNLGPLRTVTTVAGGPIIRTNQFDQVYLSVGGRVGYNLTPMAGVMNCPEVGPAAKVSAESTARPVSLCDLAWPGNSRDNRTGKRM